MHTLERNKTTQLEAFAPPGLQPLGLHTGDRALAMLAHPDDASVMMDELVRRLIETGVQVDAAIATNGERGEGDPRELHNGSRVTEEQNYWASRDISTDNQHFLRRPDGRLHRIGRERQLTNRLLELLKAETYDSVITLGETGFDGHLDHQASYRATLAAVDRLFHITGQAPAMWALNPNGTGSARFRVDTNQKIGGIVFHGSQFSPAARQFWRDKSKLRPYAPLFFEETYDLVRPRRSKVVLAA